MNGIEEVGALPVNRLIFSARPVALPCGATKCVGVAALELAHLSRPMGVRPLQLALRNEAAR